MTCPDKLTLSAYLDKELDGAQVRAIEGHLADCATCSDALDDMKTADNAVAALFSAVTLPARFALRRHKRPQRLSRAALVTAAAAAILLVVGVGAWLTIGPPSQPAKRPAVTVVQPQRPQEGATPVESVATEPAARTVPDWLRMDAQRETYGDFMARIESRSKPAIDMDSRFQAERNARPAPERPVSGGRA